VLEVKKLYRFNVALDQKALVFGTVITAFQCVPASSLWFL